MAYEIKKAAVLGAGVMGATIAAHLANAGVEVLMLDIVPRELNEQEAAKGLTLESPAVRNRIAANGLQGLIKMKPAPLYLPEYLGLIQVGNLEDDLAKLATCDWIVEVVVEYMPIKLELLQKIAPHISATAVLSTNTSGLSVNEMARVLPDDLKKRFLVTHFFNPPRYMRLMEIVPCRETDPQVVQDLADELLAVTAAVAHGCVDKVDAQVDGQLEGGHGLLVAAALPPIGADAPGAKADL